MTANEFEQLWSSYKNDVYRFCLHLVCDRDRADDLYQDTALTAFRKVAEIEADNNPKSYIFSIAVKLWHNAFKKMKRRGEDTALPIDDELDAADETNTEKTIENVELNSAVHSAIASLDEKLRIPLMLYYFDEHGIDFISQVMKIPQGTVKSRLHKARALVRKRLEEGGYSYE